MSNVMSVFKAEVADGVAELVRNNTTVAYLSPITIMDRANALAVRPDKAIASDLGLSLGDPIDDEDLFYMRDILVTTGWNNNADVFDPAETWAARGTSKNKPLNFNHRQHDIIGHIVASRAVDEDLNPIAEDTAVDELPAKFHIANASIIYRSVGDQERQEQIATLISEIGAGEWFVSMECFLRGFDYAVIAPDSSQHVITRNEKSAFLTKYMRQYGGDGKYMDPATGLEYTLGRLARNISFSGKGIVKTPGNPESVILSSVSEFSCVPGDLGYIIASREHTPTLITETSNMAEVTNAEVQLLQSQLKDAQAKIDQLNEQAVASKSQGLESKVVTLTADVASKDAEIEGLKAQVATITETVNTVTARAEAAEAARDTASAELTKLATEKAKASRVSLLKEKGAEEAVAASLVDQLAALTEEAFAATVEVLAKGFKVEAKTPTKTETEVEAIVTAKAEPEVALAVEEKPESATAAAKGAARDFFNKSFGRKGS